jgi:hypothetical protein
MRTSTQYRTTPQYPEPITGQLLSDNICAAEGITAYSRTPILTACRELLSQGIDPDRALEVYRNGILALRVRSIREGARLTVREDRGVPEFAPYKALSLDAVQPRTAIDHQAGTGQPEQAGAVP